MTISTSSNRISYNGNGVTTTPFNFPYYFLANTDLLIYVGGILQVLTTNYSVTGAGVSAGGVVTFVVAPPVGTANIVIIRDVDTLQSSALPSNGPFPAETVERMSDKLTMAIQRSRDLVSRGLTLSDADVSGASTFLPTPIASNLLGWNASANAIINYAGAVGVAVTAFMSTVLLAANAAAARTLLGAADFSTVDTKVQNQTAIAFTTGGTSAAFTLTPTPAITANAANQLFFVKFNAAPTGSPTLAISGQAALNLKYYDSTGAKQFVTSVQVPINWQSPVFNDGTDWVVENSLPTSKLTALPNLTVTQAANAATITLSPFVADFRNATLTSGTPNTRVLAANASVVLASGATLGVPTVGTVASITAAGTTVTLNAAPSVPIQIGDVFAGANIPTNTTVVSFGTYVGGVGTGTIVLSNSVTTTATACTFTKPSRIMILAIDNAGTIEVAVVNQAGGNNIDETGLISTTAVSAAATANNVVYSTTARTGVPYKVVGFFDVANPTAGQYSVPNLLVTSASGRELAAMWAPGNGQTWQNLVTQRVAGQTYYNTSGRPSTVSISSGQNAGTGANTAAVVNGVTVGNNAIPVNSGSASVNFIVPAGGSYSGTLTYDAGKIWAELK